MKSVKKLSREDRVKSLLGRIQASITLTLDTSYRDYSKKELKLVEVALSKIVKRLQKLEREIYGV